MALLTKNQLLNRNDRKTAIVDMTEEWGGDIKIIAYSFRDSQLINKVRESNDSLSIIREMLLISCVNEDGSKMFNEDDIDKFLDNDVQDVLKVFNAIIELNKVDDGDLEKEAKN